MGKKSENFRNRAAALLRNGNNRPSVDRLKKQLLEKLVNAWANRQHNEFAELYLNESELLVLKSRFKCRATEFGESLVEIYELTREGAAASFYGNHVYIFKKK